MDGDEKMIDGPCLYCGRHNEDGTWYSPCPSDDCPQKSKCCPKCGETHWLVPQGQNLVTCQKCFTLYQWIDGVLNEIEICSEPETMGPTDYLIASAGALGDRVECLRQALQAIKEHAKMGNATLCFSVAFNALNTDDAKVPKETR